MPVLVATEKENMAGVCSCSPWLILLLSRSPLSVNNLANIFGAACKKQMQVEFAIGKAASKRLKRKEQAVI